MAGLFSKKSKKDKEEKAAAKSTAAAAAASVTGVPATGPPPSTGSVASSTSNLPSSHKAGSTAPAQATGGAAPAPAPAPGTGTGPGPGVGAGGTHVRDNSAANNSSISQTSSIGGASTASEYALQQQHQLQQHQQQLYGIHIPSNKSSFDSDKARMYHLQQHHHQQQPQPHHTPNNVVSSSSVSTHNSFVNTNGPWISVQVLSLNPFPRFSHTASFVQTGTDIYVFGGVVKGSAQKDMHVIDFQSLHSQILPAVGDSPPPTSGHTSVTLGQYIMYYGGKDAKNKCIDALYVLHTVRKEWNRPMIQGLLPAPRHSHSACVIGTIMYIFGGQFNSYYLNDISAFDMKSLNTPSPKWNRLDPASELPPARAGHCAAAHDGKVYIFGGADEQFFYNDIWCYDPLSNKWEAVPAFGVLPTSRQGHAACIVDDTMYIFGGMNHEDMLLGDLSAFKFNDRRWLTFPDTTESPSPRTEHAMCTVTDKIYILGGQLELDADDEAGTVYILDTTKIRYQEPSSLGSQRSGYDDDGVLRLEIEVEDSGVRVQRPTPSPDSIRQHNNDESRHILQQRLQQQQQQQLIESKEHYSSPSVVHSSRFVEDSNLGSFPQPRMSLDSSDPNPASRRRATGKPHVYADLEQPRATQSIDETRRPAILENDFYSHSQRPLQHNNGVHPTLQQQQLLLQQQQQQQQQQDLIRRASLDNRSRGATNQPPVSPPPRGSMDQARTGTSSIGVTATPTPTVNKHDAITSQHSSKDAEIRDLKQREQWLLAEVVMARKRMGEQPLSLTTALKDDMGAFDADQDSEKYRVMQALLGVKAELERSKTTIVTQAQVASNKLREAERVRTAALQEAAYLKAKVSALQSGEVSSLVATETGRAVDLEKRLMAALALVDRLQSQVTQHDLTLEREHRAREVTQERERLATTRAEEAELSHTRSLAELATLHERASRAEAGLRECEAKNAANEAGLSSYQQQSSALFSQISALKTTVDHQKKALEKTKLAYTVANDRAEHADRMWTQARQETDNKQLEFAGVRADLERAQREADHWKAKAQDTDLLWQKAKSENEAMRALMEDDMNESAYTTGTSSRKHDSIMAITSASRVAELEHELGTLRHLLRESQAAAAQANKDLGEAMVRISQLEQTSMTSRAEAAKARRQLTMYEDKVTSFEEQLNRKEEALEEMAKEQENNEVQLGVLRGVMRENGLLADDLILEALSQSGDGKPSVMNSMTDLNNKIQELEKQAQEAEARQEELNSIKKQQEDMIQQLETDYQTALHYVQGSENMHQRLRDEAQAVKTERDVIQAKFEQLEIAHAQCSEFHSSAGEAAAAAAVLQFEGEIAELHRQLHDAEKSLEEASSAFQSSEAAAEVTQIELKTLKAKHHEHTMQAATMEGYQTKVEQLEASVEETQESLAETRHLLETTQFELEQVRELNKSTNQELEDALTVLKVSQEKTHDNVATVLAEGGVDQGTTRLEDAEKGTKNDEQVKALQKTIQDLHTRNQDLEQELRASENKISILLDNFQGPDSVRNSASSLSGSDDLILKLLETTNQQHLSASASAAAALGSRSHLTPMSHGYLTDRSSSDSLANELELLQSNWGQAQLNGAVYRPGAAIGPAGPSATSVSEGDPSVTLNAPVVTSSATNDSFPAASSPVAGGEEVISSSSSSSSSKATPAAPLTLTSAQKLEEYGKMIEDMSNAQRQYEE